jgi:hypothetical protein
LSLALGEWSPRAEARDRHHSVAASHRQRSLWAIDLRIKKNASRPSHGMNRGRHVLQVMVYAEASSGPESTDAGCTLAKMRCKFHTTCGADVRECARGPCAWVGRRGPKLWHVMGAWNSWRPVRHVDPRISQSRQESQSRLLTVYFCIVIRFLRSWRVPFRCSIREAHSVGRRGMKQTKQQCPTRAVLPTFLPTCTPFMQ